MPEQTRIEASVPKDIGIDSMPHLVVDERYCFNLSLYLSGSTLLFDDYFSGRFKQPRIVKDVGVRG
ncbi:MAG: hypothetical protein BJBARM4_0840 [Candidatus Parvarchaeum acidiphilum ARMAN-4]|uniref:Uncharacterized protein n=1 Tax=Candidatus Parvarchaeum acidiphilum ARMAN-4 TaxID=662760 RepID=D2EGE1_PARA4|nr:MAG: hypothetical protein BJBARM4_0840 [Candidatus Parvarchaeum acidiphilum ARMAN-4]